MEKTDIEAVKDVAIQFLYEEPVPIEKIASILVIHPYLESRVAVLRNIGGIPDKFDIFEDKQKYKKWQQQMVDYINKEKNWERILIMISVHYKLVFFKYVNAFLSPKDFAKMLIACWTRKGYISDETNISTEELISWFEQADKKYLMDEDEQEILKKMPDQIKVYRGVREPEYKNGFSWTVDFETAEFFAKWSKKAGDKTYIYECTISKDDILCYTDARGEAEVIINPKILKKYQIKEMDV